jgi:hypothetical protein
MAADGEGDQGQQQDHRQGFDGVETEPQLADQSMSNPPQDLVATRRLRSILYGSGVGKKLKGEKLRKPV